MSRKPRNDTKEAAVKHAGEAISVLLELMRNSSSDPVRVAAARELLDRAHGKPKAEPEAAPDGQSLSELIRRSFEREDP